MSTKKAAGGRANQGTPRKGRRLGLKKYSGEKVIAGNIIIRQAGSTFHAGLGALMGKDFTIHALKSGKVNFRILHNRKLVEVI